jgi:hypothetical protein
MTSLEAGAYALPLDSLRDVWEVRFGDRWVSMQEIRAQKDPVFYDDALQRLSNITLMERVTRETGSYYRIVPRAK